MDLEPRESAAFGLSENEVPGDAWVERRGYGASSGSVWSCNRRRMRDWSEIGGMRPEEAKEE